MVVGHPSVQLAASLFSRVLRKVIPFRLFFYDILIKNPLVTSVKAMKKQTERMALDVHACGSQFVDLEHKKKGPRLP